MAARKLVLESRTSISIARVDPLTLFGTNDRNLLLIEKNYGVSLVARGDRLLLNGSEDSIQNASGLIEHLLTKLRSAPAVDEAELRSIIESDNPTFQSQGQLCDENAVVQTYKDSVRARTEGQARYLKAISRLDIVFAIGPAGTGKTFLAVSIAVAALRLKRVSRIVLVRPAVEAGERLGFLPGALEDKVDPYLRPLYDALQNLLGPERLRRFQDMKIIEVAPLAYMRGRTLDDAFIILDEAQNTTPQQMKMFLTRLGSASKAVITGDITQTDLPEDQPSGLVEVEKILKNHAEIAFIHLDQKDVVRHPLVQSIIRAYEHHENGDPQPG
jgi:phosphate starvation-inducible PhoH-like protein